MDTNISREPIERDDEDERELAKKLAAACITHSLRLKSIDYVRKTYLKGNDEVGPAWIESARHARMIQQGIGVPVRTNLKQ
jgi:hypothetical protein